MWQPSNPKAAIPRQDGHRLGINASALLDLNREAMITGRAQLCLESSWRDILRIMITQKCPAVHCVSVLLGGTVLWEEHSNIPLGSFSPWWMFCLSLVCQSCNPQLSLLPDLPVVAMASPRLWHTRLELEDGVANEKLCLSFPISPGRQRAWSHGPAPSAWEHRLGPGRASPLLAGSG